MPRALPLGRQWTSQTPAPEVSERPRNQPPPDNVETHGYLPIGKTGADLLFQVISQRYERGSIVLTTNQPYKYWAKIFNNDSTLTSAVLDRLLHHADTVVIEGKSFRMKDQIEAP
jgi:hypothetical protein